MVERTWTGGGNNKARNPNDWSPAGRPQPGDLLQIQGTINAPFQSYTIKIAGNELANDTLTVDFARASVRLSDATLTTSPAAPLGHFARGGAEVDLGTATFNMSSSALDLYVAPFELIFGGTATVNLRGVDSLRLEAFGAATVNLHRDALWTGRFDTNAFHGGSLTINAAPGAKFANNGDSTASFGADVVVPLPVLGEGTFAVSAGAKLEFSESVGPRQSVTVSSISQYGGGIVRLDHPQEFLGTAAISYNSTQAPTFGPLPEIDLVGLAGADSYSFQNDSLTIFAGRRIIETLRLHDTTQYGFVVEKTPASVNIVAIADPANSPAGLPLHSLA